MSRPKPPMPFVPVLSLALLGSACDKGTTDKADARSDPPAKTDPGQGAEAKPEPKPESKSGAGDTPAKGKAESGGRNGKGDGPRNIFSEEFRSNYDSIDWSR